MEFVSELSGRWLEVLVAVYLIGMILYGHYRGFIRLAVSLLSLVIALTAVSAATVSYTHLDVYKRQDPDL